MSINYKGRPGLYFQKHPSCNYTEFQLATGGSKQSWYDARHYYRKNIAVIPYRRSVSNETKFIVANPNATLQEFCAETGGDKYRYSQARGKARQFFKSRGIPNPIMPYRLHPQFQASFEFKQEPKKTFIDKAIEIVQSAGLKGEPLENPQPWKEVKSDFVIKEEHVSLGITPDFIWYESTQMRNDLNHAISKNMNRFEHLVRVMEARHADNQKMITDLMNQVKDLKAQNNALMSNRYTKD
jgi:hypothetical protein